MKKNCPLIKSWVGTMLTLPTLNIRKIETDGQVFIDSVKGDICAMCDAPRFLFGNPKACSRPSFVIYPNRTVVYKDIVPFGDGTASIGSPLLPFDTVYVKSVAGDVVFNGNVRFTRPVTAPLNDITKTSSIVIENLASNVVFEPVKATNACTASNALTKWTLAVGGLEFRQNGPNASSLVGGSNAAFIQNAGGELYVGGAQNARAMSFFPSGPLSRAVCIGVTPENAPSLVALEKSNLSTYKLVVNGTAWSSGWRTVSDANMKTNVLPINHALSKIHAISGYTYNLRRNDGDDESVGEKRCAGVMAQDVGKVLPEAVDVLHDGSHALDYNGVISLLVEAVKELDMRSRNGI